jgi:5-methylcytosine-specific restriction endonuclease McrA
MIYKSEPSRIEGPSLVKGWIDRDVSWELRLRKENVRVHRQYLEQNGYIKCVENNGALDIIINNLDDIPDKPTIIQYTREQIKDVVWHKTDGICWYCGHLLHKHKSKGGARVILSRLFTIDHVIPKEKNGSDSFDNLVPSCINCNSEKKEWIR